MTLWPFLDMNTRGSQGLWGQIRWPWIPRGRPETAKGWSSSALPDSPDLGRIWLEAAGFAEQLGLHGFHVKVTKSDSGAVLFERRWCAGDVTPFMIGDKEPGFLAGFVVTGQKGLLMELLFEGEGESDPGAEAERQTGVAFLRERLVACMIQFDFTKNEVKQPFYDKYYDSCF